MSKTTPNFGRAFGPASSSPGFGAGRRSADYDDRPAKPTGWRHGSQPAAEVTAADLRTVVVPPRRGDD